jgi:hypothetical protein
MDPLVQLAVLQPVGLGVFHSLLVKWSYVLQVKTTTTKEQS